MNGTNNNWPATVPADSAAAFLLAATAPSSPPLSRVSDVIVNARKAFPIYTEEIVSGGGGSKSKVTISMVLPATGSEIVGFIVTLIVSEENRLHWFAATVAQALNKVAVLAEEAKTWRSKRDDTEKQGGEAEEVTTAPNPQHLLDELKALLNNHQKEHGSWSPDEAYLAPDEVHEAYIDLMVKVEVLIERFSDPMTDS